MQSRYRGGLDFDEKRMGSGEAGAGVVKGFGELNKGNHWETEEI